MSELPGGPAPDDRPRPTPRPRPGSAARPSPRPRVAGSRRDRDAVAAPAPAPASAPAPSASGRPAAAATGRGRFSALVVVLSLLCLAAAAGAGVLLWQRLNPGSVDSAIFAATRSGIEAVYAYDYKDSEGSVKGKLAVLTGELRDQYEKDLTQGAIIDTYEQVSATTRYEVLDVGLKQVSKAQDTATLVVFGQYVVQSVNSGTKPAPEGSGCRVTPAGAQSCTQTVRVTVVDVGGQWKISELTLLTTS